jgi:hypothetical protein
MFRLSGPHRRVHPRTCRSTPAARRDSVSAGALRCSAIELAHRARICAAKWPCCMNCETTACCSVAGWRSFQAARADENLSQGPGTSGVADAQARKQRLFERADIDHLLAIIEALQRRQRRTRIAKPLVQSSSIGQAPLCLAHASSCRRRTIHIAIPAGNWCEGGTRLFDTHSSGRFGSPNVTGSTRCLRSSSKVARVDGPAVSHFSRVCARRSERGSALARCFSKRAIAGRTIKNAPPSRSDLTTHFISPPNSPQSRFTPMGGNSKSPALTRTRGTRHALGGRTHVNASREPVAELELQSRLPVVGTHPSSRSRQAIRRPDPGWPPPPTRASTYFRSALPQSGTQPWPEPMPAKLQTP